MRYLTRIKLDSKRLKSGDTVELYRHVIELDNGKSVDVDDELDYYKKFVERKFKRITINPDYTISANNEPFTTILLAVELVKFIDEQKLATQKDE